MPDDSLIGDLALSISHKLDLTPAQLASLYPGTDVAQLARSTRAVIARRFKLPASGPLGLLPTERGILTKEEGRYLDTHTGWYRPERKR